MSEFHVKFHEKKLISLGCGFLLNLIAKATKSLSKTKRFLFF